MPIPVIASMAVKGIFNGGKLLSGLGRTAARLKEAGQRSKSTTTEMKRMTGHAKMLAGALTGISVAGFTALMMSAPQLAGSLAKIKTEMMLMAYAVGAKLKPALDAVGTILRGIRTGDWTVVKQGVSDLATALYELMTIPGDFIIDVMFGEGTAEQTREDFSNWVTEIQKAWDEGTLFDVAKSIIWPAYSWVDEHVKSYFIGMGEKVRIWAETKGKLFGQNIQQQGLGEALRGMPIIGKMLQLSGYDRAAAIKEEKIYEATGEGGWNYGAASRAAEAEKTTNININFAGANISAASEEDVEILAERLAKSTVVSQQSVMI